MLAFRAVAGQDRASSDTVGRMMVMPKRLKIS
jgi:hypothetical protein